MLTLCYPSHTMINVEVEKNINENTANLIRRFTKRVRDAGILKRVRKIRYNERNKSKYIKKKETLKGLLKKAKYEELIKLGKITEQTRPYKRH